MYTIYSIDALSTCKLCLFLLIYPLMIMFFLFQFHFDDVINKRIAYYTRTLYLYKYQNKFIYQFLMIVFNKSLSRNDNYLMF